jgi:hypothetical protein
MKPVIVGIATAGLLLSGNFVLAQTSPRTAPADTSSTMSPARSDDNQAVATTSANASIPAKGANSFTMGEAKSRIEGNGFSNVSALSKDDNGIWHGNAQKGGNTTTVWLDYKGNVGESK